MRNKGILILLMCLFILFSPSLFDSRAIASEAPLLFNVSLYIEDIRIDPETEYLIDQGNMMVPVSAFENMGVEVDWYPEQQIVILTKDTAMLGLVVGRTKVLLNGDVVDMPVPSFIQDGAVMVPIRVLAETFGQYVAWNGSTRTVVVTADESRYEEALKVEQTDRGISQKKKVVVIDPGHGGSETGAFYYDQAEKELNLQIALKLRDLLERNGIIVQMTRTDDRGVDLYYRAQYANQLQADLFVSVHNNAASDRSTTGTMTLYYPTAVNTKGKLNGERFAEIIQDELVKELKTRDFGEIPRPNLVVLRKTAMPAVIAEIGFMTNYDELQKLKTEDYQYKTAMALCNGILKALEVQ